MINSNFNVKDIVFRTPEQSEYPKEFYNALYSTIEEIFDTFDFNVFVIDTDGKFEFVNRHYCSIIEMEKSEIIGKNVKQVLPKYLFKQYKKGREILLKEKYAEKYKDLQLFTSPNGEEHLFLTGKTVLSKENIYCKAIQSNKDLFLGTGIDVIDFEKAEEELKKERDDLGMEKIRTMEELYYAQYIQSATLPSLDYIKECFPESFVFYEPMNIVSGDFYWVHKSDKEITLAVGDCSGHGVPGALMSMLGVNSLNEIAINKGINSPKQILEELDNRIERDLNSKKEKNSESKLDGIDISVCRIDTENNILTISLANSMAYIMRGNECIEIKGSIHSIGGIQIEGGPKKDFSSHEIKIEKGDILYLFSDGYADQLGGRRETQKEMRISRDLFKKIINEISELPLGQQKEILKKFFNTRKGSTKQTDDVLVFGVELPFKE